MSININQTHMNITNAHWISRCVSFRQKGRALGVGIKHGVDEAR